MKNKRNKNFFELMSTKITIWTGSATAFTIALSMVIIWVLTGPIFNYSETWQLVINTGTTIVTFLMVFLIQKAQNKDSKAIQIKLNELIAASLEASNRIVDIENLDEKELDDLRKFYTHLSDLSRKEADIHQSHSIDAARRLHEIKSSKEKSKQNIKKMPKKVIVLK